MELLTCPHCKVEVAVTAEEICPSCRRSVADAPLYVTENPFQSPQSTQATRDAGDGLNS